MLERTSVFGNSQYMMMCKVCGKQTKVHETPEEALFEGIAIFKEGGAK